MAGHSGSWDAILAEKNLTWFIALRPLSKLLRRMVGVEGGEVKFRVVKVVFLFTMEMVDGTARLEKFRGLA